MTNWIDFDIIAEIGGNHEGDFEYAKALTELAIGSRADVIKFQIYTGESLVNPIVDPTRAAHFNRFALTIDQYKELAAMVRKAGKVFNASIWDWSLYQEFRDDITFIKIGSGDLTAYPLLRKLAAEPKPMIISTGLSTLAEIEDMLRFLASAGRDLAGGSVALMQCTSMYPITDDEANLQVIPMLKEHFGLPVGYSDHTTGQDAAWISYGFGAEFVEVHFTDTRENRSFRDHQVSFTPSEIDALADKLARIKLLGGSPIKGPTASELSNGHLLSFRRAVYPARDIKAGETVSEDMLATLRPAQGIPASQVEFCIGKKARRDLKMGEVLLLEDFYD